MPSTVDITCKIIPLYRVRIFIEDEGKSRYDYERHIVADSMSGLIEGIIDAELNENIDFEDKEVHMTFDVQDFLYMPCKGAKRGFHLFDIDEVDCATWYGASIDQQIWYSCQFSGDLHSVELGKTMRDLSKEFKEAIYAEPQPVSDVEDQNHDRTISGDEIEDRLADDEAIMTAIYRASKTHPHRAARLTKEAQRDTDRESRAAKHIEKLIEEEADRVKPMPPVGRWIDNAKNPIL